MDSTVAAFRHTVTPAPTFHETRSRRHKNFMRTRRATPTVLNPSEGDEGGKT